MISPWVVSVLSTDYDLHKHRSAIVELLQNEGVTASAFELPDFPVEPNIHSHDACLRALDRTDISILIIDKRYGGIYYDLPKESGTTEESETTEESITEKEYLSFLKTKKPALVFVSKEAWDERHHYKTALKASEICQKDFDNKYKCSYVQDVRVIHFIESIQYAYEKHGASNWISIFNSIEELEKEVVGKLKGLTRYYLNEIINTQANKLKARKTTTGLSMSLGDVFQRGYYISPLYEITSGSISDSAKELDDKIVESICTNNSILVLGEAGYGKTTLLAKSFLNHVDLLNVKLDYNMPFYIWLKGKKQSYHFSFKDYISECFEEYFNKDNYPFINLDNISPYFYIDGFDELTEKLSNAEINNIASAEMFKYPTLLTCRRQYANRYISNSNFSNKFNVIICVKEWDENQADKYIENFCEKQGEKEEYKEKISILLSDNKDLKSILNNPLLITMLLWVIETKRMVIPETIHSRVELFKECLNEMAKRELSRAEITSIEYNDLVLEWSYFAWEVYHQKLNNAPTMIKNCLQLLESSCISFIEYEKFVSSIQAIFDIDGDTVYGTYHEQFLEFLVANALHDACIKKQYPYPIFLQYILRPEINRYFRALWIESNENEKDTIATNLLEQYTANLFDDSNNSVSKRVHSIYHLSRFNLDKHAEKLKNAFNKEEHISVILSFYFGTIKMGDLDCEKRFYDLLTNDSNYNVANRGYHLAYYADSIIEGDLPYFDNGRDLWNGTLSAFLRHFESGKINHFYLRRIDITTMQHLISARGCTEPLTDNIMNELEHLVYHPPFKVANFQKDIEKAFEDLKNKYTEIKNS